MSTISAYTTTRNCQQMNYPYRESIKSMLAFADEVVVVDSSDGTDDTSMSLQELSREEGRVKVYFERDRFDWLAPNHGILDGQTKALSRSYCSGDFLWQFDVDEIVHEKDALKIKPLTQTESSFQHSPIIALPVVEYWGSAGKVRMDINPGKARLSKNDPDITHGIPIQLRRTINGLAYAYPGTDTCDYISKNTGAYIPVTGFMSQHIEKLRSDALNDSASVAIYQNWFNKMIDVFPGVFHYSWYSVERKIRQYQIFWTSFWKSMYGPDMQQNKDPLWNPFFEVPWSEVTDEMIVAAGKLLEDKTGGHIFHSRWNGSTTPSIYIKRSHPAIITDWLKTL